MFKKSSSLLLLSALFLGVFLFGPSIKAAAGDVTGWAWSGFCLAGPCTLTQSFPPDGSIGWISFGSANRSVGAPYAVNVTSTSILNGYAWADVYDNVGNTDNVGWIRFDIPRDDLKTCPNAPLLPCEAANMNPQTGEVNGWARACGVYASGCEGTLLPDYIRGGWDGWIKLRGQTANGDTYGVQLALSGPETCTFGGWAYGGGSLSWISFNNDNTGGREPYFVRGSGCGGAPPAVVPLACSPKDPLFTVDVGTEVTLSANGGDGNFSWTTDADGSVRGGSNQSRFFVTYSIPGPKTVTVQDSSGASDSCPVSVIPSAGGVPFTLRCDPPNATVSVGDEITLTANGGNGNFSWTTDADGSVRGGSNQSRFFVTYSIPGNKTATVRDSDGAADSCTIDVNLSGGSTEPILWIEPPRVQLILGVRDTAQLRACYNPNGGAPGRCSDPGVIDVTNFSETTWSSDDPLTVSLDDPLRKGFITGHKNGFAQITAVYNVPAGSRAEATVPVTVRPPRLREGPPTE